MELRGFYSVVATINFTLLGLWWLVIRERTDIGRSHAAGRRMGYVVSLQFLIPGTMSLLAQVAPDVPLGWRSVFAFAGAAGAVATLLLAPTVRAVSGQVTVSRMLRWVASPIYLAVAANAALPSLAAVLPPLLSPLQTEALLLCVLVGPRRERGVDDGHGTAARRRAARRAGQLRTTEGPAVDLTSQRSRYDHDVRVTPDPGATATCSSRPIRVSGPWATSAPGR